MDYVVGSVAALVSGNVTPNRPKISKRAMTPIKHQPSPNVTPKSQLVDDRSIFLSPTLQKKKAIIKKSPKRIFQSDAELKEDPSVISPQADKVKKHLKKDLDIDNLSHTQTEVKVSKKVQKLKVVETAAGLADNKHGKKKKKRLLLQDADHLNSVSETLIKNSLDMDMEISDSPKKCKEKSKSMCQVTEVTKEKIINKANSDMSLESECKISKKKKKSKEPRNANISEQKKSSMESTYLEHTTESDLNQDVKVKSLKQKKNNSKVQVNPNAITNKDSDSEHDSDDDIESETEQTNNEIMGIESAAESSDEDDLKQKNKGVKGESNIEMNKAEDLKRTIFVGNVPFSPKCKKEIKKIFRKYGIIDTIRIRTVPVKDAQMTPKVAVIKNELHPERSTVNVYVKFNDMSSAKEALAENNTILNGCHLRVSKSESTGEDHDPRCSIFVGNLPFALEDETLRQKFEACGVIDSVRIIRDKKTNAGKGFGYVNFKSKDGVELALSMSDEDLTIKNRIIRVKRCTQLTQKHYSNKQQWHVNKNQGGSNRNQINKFTKGNFNQNQQGAYRRIGNKRKNQDGAPSGPPSKVQRTQTVNQPVKEKKPRKEFVGMTADKKKKRKFNKDQRKKKQLSELLMKS